FSDGGVFPFGEKRANRVEPEAHNGRSMLGVGFVEHAPFAQLNIENLPDGWLVALQNHVFRAKNSTANVGGAGSKLWLEDAHGRRRSFDMRQARNVFGPLGLKFLAREPFARRTGKRSPRKAISDDSVRTEVANSAENIFVEAVDERADRDDRGDA